MSITRIESFDHLICEPTASVREVIQRIDQSTPNLFQIVVDSDNRLLGTVTDGDIRRGILNGCVFEDPIERCMHVEATVGRAGDEAGAMKAAMNQRFLPVCDAEDRLVHILLRRKNIGAIHRAVVMAGGFGKRMGERTQKTPKPLLSVGGAPILGRILDQLEAAEVERIEISVHYLADQIEAFIAARENNAQIDFVREIEPMGTAGALSLIREPIAHPVLVMNGDVLTQVDLAALDEFHHAHDFDATIATTTHETKIPFGVIKRDASGLFAGIDEKPVMKHFVSAGIYYLAPVILSLIPSGRAIDMPELLEIAARQGLRIGLFPVHEYWADLGRPADFDEADREFT